jgi:hypothetical protein
MAHVASRNPKTAADERFEEYLSDHAVPYEYEPPWDERLEVSAEVNPDFLIDPAGAQVVAEVKQFEATHITDRDARVGTLSDRDVYGHQRAKMTEAAREQLRPFASAGVPLVVVLANPLGADVAMDFHHIAHAILGNPKFTISVGPDAPPDDPGEYIAEDYGAFRSVTDTGPVNHHPHVSAVVVVHERRHETDWIEQRLRQEPRVEDLSQTGEQMVRYLKIVEDARKRGEVPEGTYRWVEVYDLSGNPTPPGFKGVPLPRAVFNGPRDQWYGFTGEGLGEID